MAITDFFEKRVYWDALESLMFARTRFKEGIWTYCCQFSSYVVASSVMLGFSLQSAFSKAME